MRPLNELINRSEPAWLEVQKWLSAAANPVQVLPRDAAAAESELLKTQVTTRSPMGAVVYETGGILADGGWLRILGSGSPLLPRGLGSWNLGRTQTEPGAPAPYYLIADDAAGGFFALNGGGLEGRPGNVFYFAPDTLAWEDCGFSYSDFLYWALNGDLQAFYENLRWQGWQADAAALGGNRVFSFMPFLWTAQGQDINRLSRRAVPIEEHFAMILGKAQPTP